MFTEQVVICCVTIYFSCAFAIDDYPQIEIDDGTLKGKYMNSRGGRKFSAFLGIPFAVPPVGALRFQPPMPAKPWQRILNATSDHAVCPQRDVYRRSSVIEGEEDCLYLNVYTPKSRGDLVPVMVFFHGGGFLCGGGNSYWYGPDILLDHEIVLVVTNYRLGALGFLTTGDEVVPGNNGLKDQSLALKWVNKNIHKFGGDPEKVSLFGESAGGASSHFHMLSPLSKGLFNAVIAQSGTALCSWALGAKGEGVENSKKLAKIFKCSTETSQAMVECLRKVDARAIIEQDVKFMEWDYDPMIPFKPVIEAQGEGSFLTAHPLDLIKSGKYAQVPLIVGINSEDGALKVAGMLGIVHEFNDRFDEIVPMSLMYHKVVENFTDTTAELKTFYFKDKKIDSSSIEHLINLYTDGWFLNCANDAVKLHLQYSTQPVYYYLFSHRGVASFTSMFGGGDKDFGVSHADELQYLFPVGDSLFPDKKPSDEDKLIRKLLTTLWTNFAKTGNPTPELNNIIVEKWEPVQSDKIEYYNIHPKSTGMRSGLFSERTKLWSSINKHISTSGIKDEL